MARHARGRNCGGGIAGALGSRRFHQHIHGGRGPGGGGSSRKLVVRGGRIDQHGGRIEGEEDWIVVRGCRIGRAGFRINSQGEVYAPDSEDEGADMATEKEDVGVFDIDAILVQLLIRGLEVTIIDYKSSSQAAGKIWKSSGLVRSLLSQLVYVVHQHKARRQGTKQTQIHQDHDGVANALHLLLVR